MSSKNSDNQNTSTIYIDRRDREAYEERMRHRPQPHSRDPYERRAAEPAPYREPAPAKNPLRPVNNLSGHDTYGYNDRRRVPEPEPYREPYIDSGRPVYAPERGGYDYDDRRRVSEPEPYREPYNDFERPVYAPDRGGYGYDDRRRFPEPDPYSESGRTAGHAAPPRKRTGPPKKKRPAEAPPPKKKRKKKKPLIVRIIIRVLLILFIIFLILFGVYSCTSLSLISKLEYVETGDRTRTRNALERDYVTNILLIGSDSRGDERGRSDTMMLLSINSKTDEISLTSFMRDCYVAIPDYGYDKLNASYSYGGPELVMDTIEANFRVKIDNYLAIDFVSFANIVDALGGIEIDVSEAEIKEINTILQAEVNELMGDEAKDDLLDVDDEGKIKLNGKQALSYARIRYVGNADFERTERQREVMELIFAKAKESGFSTISKVSDEVLPNVSTNMTKGQLYWLSLRLPFLYGYDIQQLRVPEDGTYSFQDIYDNYGNYQSVIYLDSDGFDDNYDMLKKEVFSDSK